MNELITTFGEQFSYLAIAGISVTLISQFLKKKYEEVNPRYFVAGLSVVAGLVYALGKTFIPVEVLKQMFAFGSLAFTSAIAIYKLQK